MMAELKASGMSQEEILKKTQILMKAFNREDPTATMAEYALISMPTPANIVLCNVDA